MTCARVPGKVILTGEHAVVHGTPALALALDRYAVAEITPSARPGICLTLPDLGCRQYYSLPELEQLVTDLSTRYQAWQSQRLPLSAVLQKPEQLHGWALASWLLSHPPTTPPLAINLTVTSELASGMGASAATVAAALLALSHHQGSPLNHSQLVERVTASEHLQHGRSSGLDPAVCIMGGMIYFAGGRATTTKMPLLGNWLVIDTGRPQCSTGACVEAVASLRLCQASWQPWYDLTAAWHAVLIVQMTTEYVDLLRHNHRLLQSLGVVPQPVARFIDQLEFFGAGAKVCGAGAIEGDAAGLVLACSGTQPLESLVELALVWGYQCWPLMPAAEGASIDDMRADSSYISAG
jgi:mevalonate kinase